MKRSERENRTVKAMIGMYCHDHHGDQVGLCEECQALYAYAVQRTAKCVFGEEKPACGQCPIHCYKPQMRAKIGQVMRYAGPKMIYHHPILALRHLIMKRRSVQKPPQIPRSGSSRRTEPEGTRGDDADGTQVSQR